MEKIKTEFKQLNIREIEESPINAQLMGQSDFNRLVKNIKKDGCLTSTVLVMRQEGKKYMCISGHHRVRAAIKAGITDVPCLIMDEVDESTRIRLQLSHNDIHGEPDEELLLVLQNKLNSIDIELINNIKQECENELKEITVDKIEFRYVSVCQLPESADVLNDMIQEVDGEQKWLIEKQEYEDLKIALSKAFKAGFKTPGRAFRKFMDIVLENEKEITNGKN